MKTRETLFINKNGQLQIGGFRVSELAAKFSTPLYVMDEQYVRNVCQNYKQVLDKEYPDNLVCFASKAFCAGAIYQIVDSEGLGTDVASGGELFAALNAKMPTDKIYFHGNNKSKKELEYAIESKVHAIVIDSLYEVELLDKILKEKKTTQKVLLRVNPGIEAHTHKHIQTARVDSKFGFLISDGTALEFIKNILKYDTLEFIGIHCHIGSQIFEIEPFELAVDKMTDLIIEIKKEFGIELKELNMGGGYGITYTDNDKPKKYSDYAAGIAKKLHACVKEKNITPPKLIIEPGRSIVGEAGVTLYTVGAVKEIKDVKNYISVDGGLFENPRYTMYKAKYDAILADKADKKPEMTYTVAGKCCETDTLIEEIRLPKVESGDILAVLSTGAYNYSMASNYNKNPVPPVVLVNGNNAEYIVKPQDYQDIISRDILIKR